MTATQAELILTDSHNLFNLCADPRQSAHLRRRQRDAMGGIVRGAVSDDHDLQPPAQPAAVCPVRMSPIGPQGLAIEAAVLLEAADDIPPIVANPLQKLFGGIPGVKEHILGITMQAIADIAKEC